MNLVESLPEDSWFRDYMKAWPLAEPPISFILFSAMSMLGAALGRSIFFQQDVHKIFPLMNLLLIGPSGIGKSTSLVDMALDTLLRPLPTSLCPLIITGKGTKEAIHADLMASPHAIIVASELANMFSKEKYNEGQIPYFTDLLDLRSTSVRTKTGGLQVIHEPTICIVGGSTREWLQDQLPSSAGAGGFLPRFMIVKEDYKAQRVPDPRRALSPARHRELEIKREQVQLEFLRLVRTFAGHGGIDFSDYSASDAYGYWYQTFTPETGHLSPFAARAGVHVMRMAMLIAVSCSSVEIRLQDLECALKLYEYSHKKLQEVVVPMSPQGKLHAKLLEAIGENRVGQVTLRRAMRNYCSSQETDRMIHSLIADGGIVGQSINGEMILSRVHGR